MTCEKDVGMGLCMLRHAIPTLVFLLFGTPSLHLFKVLGNFFITSQSARTAGTKIALRFPRLFVCLFVRPHLSRAQYITSYVTMQLQYSSVWRFAGQATANEGSFVLPRWRKRGR